MLQVWGKYYPKHQCKRQLLLLEREDAEILEKGKTSKFGDLGEEDNGVISIHALKGLANNKIIKVRRGIAAL